MRAFKKKTLGPWRGFVIQRSDSCRRSAVFGELRFACTEKAMSACSRRLKGVAGILTAIRERRA
jgi:hypothetical protein